MVWSCPARSTLPFLPETPAQGTWAFPKKTETPAAVPTPDAAFLPIPEQDGRVNTCCRPHVLSCDLGESPSLPDNEHTHLRWLM